MNRKQIQDLDRWVFTHICKTTHVNDQFLPTDGACLITLNHMSRLDFPALVKTTRRDDIYAIAADKYKEFPVFGGMLKAHETIFIDRSKADFTAIKAVLAKLKEGHVIAVAPEGTRSRTAQMIEAKEGVVMIAAKAGVPIIPVGVTGTENFMAQLGHFHRPRFTVRFGPAYNLPPMDRDNREAYMKTAIDEVMCRIAALLPESYRGFYKDHARTAELCAEYKQRGDMELPY